MRKTILIYIVLCMIFSMTKTICFAENMILQYDGEEHEYTGSIYKLLVNGEEIETPLEPIIFNDRALVPVREVFEAAGAEVIYDAETKGIYVKGNEIEMSMRIGEEEVQINGKKDVFPDNVSPKLIAKKGEDAKTMVPVRFISENLGYVVNFNGEEIDILTKTEEIKKPILTDIYCKAEKDEVIISVKADEEIEKISKPLLTAAGVLYIDIFDVKSKLSGTYEIKKGAVENVRIGIHEEYVRIALDTKALKSYIAEISEDKKALVITTIKDPDAKEEPEATQKPQENESQEPDEKNEKMIVVLDAGHGGADGGAVRDIAGEKELIKEKDINLSVAKKTAEILKNNNIEVRMTREGDTYPSLAERAEFANELDAALFVSIHSNSAENSPAANGIEVYYSLMNNSDDYGIKSKDLAESILTAMIETTKANNRKVKSENHVVTRKSYMPAVLIELGFMTNDAELAKLVDFEYQDKLAKGIAEGIMKCLPKVTIPLEKPQEKLEKEAESLEENQDLGDKIA